VRSEPESEKPTLSCPWFVCARRAALNEWHAGKRLAPDTQGPSIVVAEEGGNFVFYDRARLSCDSVNRFSSEGAKEEEQEAEGGDAIQPIESWEEAQAQQAEEEEEEEEEDVETRQARARILPQHAAAQGDAAEAEEAEEEAVEARAGTKGTGGRDVNSFLAGAAMAPVAMVLMALRPYVSRKFLREAKRHNPMLSV
jgi:hypothetical protein